MLWGGLSAHASASPRDEPAPRDGVASAVNGLTLSQRNQRQVSWRVQRTISQRQTLNPIFHFFIRNENLVCYDVAIWN